MKLIIRLLRFSMNFFICASNLGILSAWVIFVQTRWSNRITTVWLKRLGRQFTFRGKADGVISHLYNYGYRILDTPDLPVRTIIDCGANIGDETVRFRYFHPDARIIAVEAEKANYEILVKNFGSDPLVTCLNKGIWPVDSHLKIHPGTQNESFWVSELPIEEINFDIEAITLKRIVQEYNLPSIDILKLDVEGAEYGLFTRNYAEWIGLINVLIFECNDHQCPGTVAALFRALSFAEFDCHISGENLVLIRRTTGWGVENVLFY